MKNLLFTLLYICCGTMLFAQNPICDANIWPTNFEDGVTTLTAADSSGTSVETYLWSTGETTPTIDVTTEGEYCVTITYAGGCSAATCYNLLFNECWSNATWWASNTGFQVNAYGGPYYLDATYEWSNGETTSSFLTTVPGTYCVTITRENGCTSTSCVNVNIPNPTCSASVEPVNFENGVTTLTAIDSANTTVSSYLWSTGETTPTIDVASEGLYCVTVTFFSGCSATACDTLSYDECWSYASAWNTPAGMQISAYAAPGYLDATYLWSNGATTSSFLTNEQGTYCVTITRENGCTSTSCVDAVIPPTNLYVNIIYGDSINNPIIAQIYLIKYDSDLGTLTAAQSQPTDANGSGSTVFTNIPAGQYLVKAAIIPGTVGFNDYLPTYSFSSLLWSDAQFVNVYANSGNGATVYLIPGNNPGGPGFIGGLVSEGANFTGHHLEAESGEGDPIAFASIILTLPDGTAVAATTTDAAGEYSFPSLAYGTYVITINIPGITPVSTTVTLSPNQPGFSGINFNVTQNGATLSASDIVFEAFAKVAPNPVYDMLQVTLKDAEGELLISNLQGQVLRQMSVNASQMQVSLANLPNGVYLLTARTAKGSQSTRIVKQ